MPYYHYENDNNTVSPLKGARNPWESAGRAWRTSIPASSSWRPQHPPTFVSLIFLQVVAVVVFLKNISITCLLVIPEALVNSSITLKIL